MADRLEALGEASAASDVGRSRPVTGASASTAISAGRQDAYRTLPEPLG
jgi:hypothetical protein